MLFPKRTDYKVVGTTTTLPASFSLPISREFWLESIILKIAGNFSTVTTPSGNGHWNLLRRARMSVTDSSGNRQVLNAWGPAILEEFRHTVGSLDRQTAAFGPGTVGIGTTGAFALYYPIMFRHPQLQDPFGAATMIPLPRLSNDPVLEIDLVGQGATHTDVAATATMSGTFTVTAQINRRDVLAPGFPYIPSELITYEKQWAASGKGDWEVPSIGTITGILQQDQTAVVTRGSVLNAVTEDWSLEYLSTVMRRGYPDMFLTENEHTNDLYPATWNNPQGALFWDFLTDFAGQDTFNMGSALDVNPLVLNGGKARIVGSNVLGGANVRSWFTARKLFGDLRAIKFA